MLRPMWMMLCVTALTACASHQAIKVRCTDRLEPINVTAKQEAGAGQWVGGDRSLPDSRLREKDEEADRRTHGSPEASGTGLPK